MKFDYNVTVFFYIEFQTMWCHLQIFVAGWVGGKKTSFWTILIRLCKIILSNCWFYLLLTGKERHQDWSVQRFWLYSFCQLRSSNEGASSETHDRWPLVWCKNPQFKGKNTRFYTTLQMAKTVKITKPNSLCFANLKWKMLGFKGTSRLVNLY